MGQVKQAIESTRADFPAAHQKLILTGKVLKDEQNVSELGITDKHFLVCVVTKVRTRRCGSRFFFVEKSSLNSSEIVCALKQPKTAAAAPAPAAAGPAAAAPAAAAPAPVPMQMGAPVAQPPTQQQAAPNYEQPENIQRLTDMGFPEAEARAALRAAMGNPDVAVEFLFNGIPEQAARAAAGGAAAAPAGGAASEGDVLDQLRRHPHINALRRMVQENPAALQNILQQIGAQNPELLNVIHQNQQAFLEIMNEPVTEDDVGAEEMMENLTPQQFVELLQNTPPQQQAALAESMGMSVEQFQGITQMISTMPPEQLQNMMAMFRGMSGGGMGEMGGAGQRVPSNAIRLTEDEMAAVRRLMELGFDQNDAVQVFLACDKNEALAANVLMDGWNGGAGGAGGAGGDFGGDFGGDGDNDDMYS